MIMDLFITERVWTVFDTMFIGLFILTFSTGISKLIVILWKRWHPKSLDHFNDWLKRQKGELK